MSSHIAAMPRLSDTEADALRVMTGLYRAMTPAEKLERVRALTLSANALALAGLRSRHPTETEPDLLMRLARIRLGDDLIALAYPRSEVP
jgi:hypothetical protein